MCMVGEKLHLRLTEVGAMSVDEFFTWVAYFEKRAKAEQKAMEGAKSKGGSGKKVKRKGR